MVYLPMSYLYGRRATAAPTPLTDLLKKVRRTDRPQPAV